MRDTRDFKANLLTWFFILYWIIKVYFEAGMLCRQSHSAFSSSNLLVLKSKVRWMSDNHQVLQSYRCCLFLRITRHNERHFFIIFLRLPVTYPNIRIDDMAIFKIHIWQSQLVELKHSPVKKKLVLVTEDYVIALSDLQNRLFELFLHVIVPRIKLVLFVMKYFISHQLEHYRIFVVELLSHKWIVCETSLELFEWDNFISVRRWIFIFLPGFISKLF